jgi:hypothetical protein
MDSLPPGEAITRVLTVLFVFAPLFSWYLSLRKFGVQIIRSVRPMFRFTLYSGSGILLMAAGFMTVGSGSVLVAHIWLPDFLLPLPDHIILLFLSISVGALLWMVRPPIVLFLTTSDAKDQVEVSNATMSLAPYRVVYLLRSRVESSMQGRDDVTDPFTDEGLQHSNLRTHGRISWEAVVHELMTLAPAIVLDVRKKNDAIITEAHYIIEHPELWAKTIVVVGPRGEVPSLNAALAKVSIRKRVMLETVRGEGLVKALRKRLDMQD